jgi:hypothetical protein
MAYVVRTLLDSFTPLRLPNLRTYLIGQAISLLGTWMQVTAQGWLVWELAGRSGAGHRVDAGSAAAAALRVVGGRGPVDKSAQILIDTPPTR